jgi:hypothetical protein
MRLSSSAHVDWSVCGNSSVGRAQPCHGCGGAPSLARDRDSSGLVSTKCAGIAQLVERNLAKVEVASSNLVSRSKVSPERLDGRVVMQRTATPFTPVRFRLEPPLKFLF